MGSSMRAHVHSFVVQINEAFASQYVYCIQQLGLDADKVNVNGGAIAFGHPLDKYLFHLALWPWLIVVCDGYVAPVPVRL